MEKGLLKLTERGKKGKMRDISQGENPILLPKNRKLLWKKKSGAIMINEIKSR